ncbi:MAG: CDP-diacylglycerol--glycerol-3-phosphate 3-phosphatidyltransferase [Coriobacteriia bacterium]|nr:CDP-diacylglycerol--glycerol-3-phosphate 3-phosphatidyltransferase [Coriobacteriia bacterium]MCL2536966.1 CDP-diacylglycerol--glycerol-3-phosphate 3-phosphatidyltransferase [Coriobacteriia bacterium]
MPEKNPTKSAAQSAENHTKEVSEKVFLKLSLASKITLARVLLIPLFLAVLLTSWPLLFSDSQLVFSLQPWIAALVFILIASTDAVDGYVARKRREVTTFGKFIDPLADKLLVTAALMALVQMGVLPAWIAFIIVAREFIVSGLRMVASANGAVIDASMFGKVKTWLQSVAIVMFIVKNHTQVLGLPFASAFEQVIMLLAWLVMIAAVVATVGSLWDYYRRVSEYLNGPWEGDGEEEEGVQ